jgi:hypothetical protein
MHFVATAIAFCLVTSCSPPGQAGWKAKTMNHYTAGCILAVDPGKFASFLLLHPGDVLLDSFMGQQQFLGEILVSEFLFVRNQVMDAIVTGLAEQQASFAHFVFAESVDESLFGVHRSGNQVVLGKALFPAAQVTAGLTCFLLMSVWLSLFSHNEPGEKGLRSSGLVRYNSSVSNNVVLGLIHKVAALMPA